MRAKSIISLIFILLALQARTQLLPNFGGERAGLSALSFLKNDMNPRSAAMGGASVALPGDGFSILTNPATLTEVKSSSFVLSHQVLGGFEAGINQSFFGYNMPMKDKISTLSFSINSLNSGAMVERTEFQPEGTGREIYVSNLAVGATYARQLSALFSAGVSLKYIYEGVANYGNHTATVDVAFIYKTDFRDLQFAVMVQNFGGNSSLNNSSDKDIPVLFNRQAGISLDANTVPTVFSLGLSIIPWSEEDQSILFAAQLNHPNDNSENYRLGLEYQLKDLFFARAGYKFSVKGQAYPTFGAGVRTRIGAHPLYIDYTINPTEYLGFQQSIGLRLSLNNVSRE